jgi:isoquinoline 1-oxidoreductase alpha subunit
MTAFTVNGNAVRYRMDPKTPLLYALREASNLTGTKNGCGSGDCGSCTVDIDGEAVMSCMISIGDCEGRYVTTIEALSPDRSHPVQQAWAEQGVTMCGFCDPGFLMAISVLLKKNGNPTDKEIEEAVTNTCRCGIYPRVIPAIRRAIEITRGDARVAAAPPPGIRPADAAAHVPALTPPPRRTER